MVLVSPPGVGLSSQVIDLASGQIVNLPRSKRDLDFGHRDSWFASLGGDELIRTDDVGGVSLLAWPSLQTLASFRPRMAEGEVLRIGAVRMSRDRQMLAATVSSERDRNARLRVFDRQGHVLASGPPMPNRSTARYDWHPDGRLLFVDEDQLLFYDVRKNQLSSVLLSFPEPTQAGGEGLALSPDGRRFALTRFTLFKRGGRERRHSVLYLFSVEGGLGRALTEPSASVLDSANGLRFFQPSWDAKGEQLAVAVSLSGDAAGAPTAAGCSRIAVLSAASGTRTPVSGASSQDPTGLRFLNDGMGGSTSEGRVSSCGSFQWW